MKIEFVGGARTVTGSSYIIKDDDFTIMVDCGMFQGRQELRDRNALQLIYAPSKIDALLLTHAHIDHSGLIPKLVKEGFYGNIYATKATVDLCNIMLPDSAHIQEMDVRFINRKNRKLGRPVVDPLYTVEDAGKCLENFVPVNYGEVIQIHPRIKVRFRDAGHILGSSFIEMWIDEKGKQTKVVFSGDLGQKDQAIIRDPEIVEDADFLLIESTYGDRLHKNKQDTYAEFREIIKNSIDTKGNIVIPSFAIGRTQEIIYTLAKMIHAGEVPALPVYIDSPLAVSATEIFRNNMECFDEETRKILSTGESPLDFETLHFTRSAEESKSLNENASGSLIISASGMCTAGRIKYHLMNNLYKPDSNIIFVGYQAEGTLGRRIIDGAKQVRLYGEDVAIRAQIHTLGGFSAHADKKGILEWIGNIKNPDLKIFVVHGEEESTLSMSQSISEQLGLSTLAPRWGEIVNLDTMESEMAKYGISEEYTEIDHDIDILFKSLEELKGQYHKKMDKKTRVNKHRLHEDIQDVKSMVSMIIDEL
ncbi:MAG: MBL fold hydrolase [Spirochaetae bacterium HGW-Spirochaetae-1]|jgi:metallo-beta-lactamase family protein|nr:MAG: MBL fold hydrolase [Spirochaetae bacterium HGW-Spirochaetae-1]